MASCHTSSNVKSDIVERPNHPCTARARALEVRPRQRPPHQMQEWITTLPACRWYLLRHRRTWPALDVRQSRSPSLVACCRPVFGSIFERPM